MNSKWYFEFMERETPLLRVDIDNGKVTSTKLQGYYPKAVIPLFIVQAGEEHPLNAKDFVRFFELRCVPKTRVGLEDILKGMGLKEYNPIAICKITHGTMWEDFYWLRFNGENVSWNDVKLRD